MINTSLGLKLNRTLLEQFRVFLDQQEAKLADALLLSALPAPGGYGTLHLHGSGHVRLSQSLQILSSRIRELSEQETSPNEWLTAVNIANRALWEYVELIKEAVYELIFQLKQADMLSWTFDFHEIVAGFKELLIHRIEDLIATYGKLEELFLAYKAICHRHKNLWVLFGNIGSRFLSILDKKILNQLFQIEEILITNFKKFSASFDAFTTLVEKSKEKEKRFYNYRGFLELTQERQTSFLKLFRFVKIWEENQRKGLLNEKKLFDSIQSISKIGTVSALFREYIKATKKRFFQIGKLWQETYDPSVINQVILIKEELSALGNLISHYREVFLNSDSQYQKKVRWSWTRWIVGPEPRKTKDLLILTFDIQKISKWCDQLITAIEKGQAADPEVKRNSIKRQMESILHEMGQPLSSRSLLQTKAKIFIDLVAASDELGGTLGDVHEMLTDVLLKALRLDSKYQVLQDYPQFEELFEIHQGFLPLLKDSQHENRLKLFQNIVNHVEHWIGQHALTEHVHDLEIDEIAIQEALQQMLAAVQRKDFPQDNGWKAYYQMLLEYRYLFSHFFHKLRSFEKEGKSVHMQFYFLDQYFEAIEKQLDSFQD